MTADVYADSPDTRPGARLTPLPTLLAEPDEPVAYRIDRLLPTGGRVVFAAQYKSGKTTATNNVLRALVDGVPLFGEFDVAPLTAGRTVVLIDDEMSRGQIKRWLRDQRIGHPERVHVAMLRGRVASFNILDAQVRSAWAAELHGVSAGVLLFDCLRPVLDALGLDETRDAGRFLVAFDALLKGADVAEAIVVHHMGHHGERSRGDSRIRDWPDVEWRLIRQSDDGDAEPNAPRFFSAYGRDVDVPEGAMTFDPQTRHLTYTSGSRQDAAIVGAYDAVLDLLSQSPEPLSGRGIETALTGHNRNAIRSAVERAVTEGTVTREAGPRRAWLHSLSAASAPVRRTAPGALAQSVSECASAYIGALHSHTLTPDSTPSDPGALKRDDTARRCERCGTEVDPPNVLCRSCITALTAGEATA